MGAGKRDVPRHDVLDNGARPLCTELLLDDLARAGDVRAEVLKNVAHKEARLVGALARARADLAHDRLDVLEVVRAALGEDRHDLARECGTDRRDEGERFADDGCVQQEGSADWEV